MANEEKRVGDEITERVRMVQNYLVEARRSKSSHRITDDGILVRFPMEILTDGLLPIAELMRGENGVRHGFDSANGDVGEHRLYETVIGILGECACVVASDDIPLQDETGEFLVDLKIYSSLGSESCYSCDLNDSVTVKTCGRWIERKSCRNGLPPTSWMAASNDVIRLCPERKKIILCKWVADNEILIMGWVNASDVSGMWSPTLKKSMRKEAIYYHRHEDNFVNAGDCAAVSNGAVADVIHPITEGSASR